MADYEMDEDQLFLDGYKDLEFVDDVTEELKCTRCAKVLLRHYIANCEHKFCSNCKRVVDDGSHRWKCPKCGEHIKEIGRQDVVFRDRIRGLRLRCPNRKYGCPHIGPLKELKEDLDECEHTRESVLPVEYRGDTAMLEQLMAFKREMEEMKEEMLEVKKRQKDGEEKLIEKFSEETTRLKNDISDLQKRPMGSHSSAPEGLSLVVEENKCKILKLEAKSESYFEMIEFNNRINNKQLKVEFHSEMESQKMSFEQKMKEMELEQKQKMKEMRDLVGSVNQCLKEERKKREEVTSTVSKSTSQISKLNSTVESLRKDFQDQLKQMSTVNQIIETVSLTLNEVKEEVAEVDSHIEEERQKREEVTSIVTQNSSQLLNLKERIESIGKDLQDQKASTSSSAEEITALKKKLKETEEKFRSLLAAEVVYKSIVRPEVQHLRRVDEYYKEKPAFTWTLSHKSGSDISRLLAGSEEDIWSEVFPLRGYPVSAQVKMELFGDYISLSLSFQDTNETNKKPEIKPIPNFCFTFKDRSENTERKDIIITNRTLKRNFKKELKFKEFYNIYNFDKKSVFHSPLYNVNDNVVLDVHVEAPEVTQSVYSYDGTLTWAIDDFRKRKQMEVEGLIRSHLSPYFYTSPKGYRVQVETLLNGNGNYKNKGVRVYINLLDGLHDKDLNEKFRHRTTLTIFHPTQPTRNISKTEINDRANDDWFDMGSKAEIENLLYEDTLYYKVTIEAL